jgi:murein DD-endopeptidase MepM/ murein hydrolase activator NlpD
MAMTCALTIAGGLGTAGSAAADHPSERARGQIAALDQPIESSDARAARGGTPQSQAASVRSRAAISRTGSTVMAPDAADQRYADLATSLQGGGRPWPGGKLTGWPITGQITSPFGPRWGGFHNGIDIASGYGVPVRAAAAGVVQVVGKPYLASGDTATVVIISHASNLSTFYGHLDDGRLPPTVRAGDAVAAGQVIGYNGSTGWSTGPHVHFMTIFAGRAVNPIPFLP